MLCPNALTRTFRHVFAQFRRNVKDVQQRFVLRHLCSAINQHQDDHVVPDDRPSYSVQDFAELVDTPETQEKLSKILALYSRAKVVPRKLTVAEMAMILEHPGFYGIMSHFRYLAKRDRLEQVKKLKRLQAAEHVGEEEEEEELVQGMFDKTGKLCYGIFNNTMLSTSHLTQYKVYGNLVTAAMFGQPFVLDFSYDDYMRRKDQTTLAVQVKDAVGYNRRQAGPAFDMHFCNYQPNEHFENLFNRMYKISDPRELLVTATTQSYLDLFPHDRLVYLSPHAEEVLQEFDHDSIYIVGSFVDHPHHVREAHSFAKARFNGIRSVKLPLDQCLDWGVGTKCLNVNHVAMIMMDLSQGLSIEQSLARHVPKRKLKSNIEKQKKRRQCLDAKFKSEMDFLNQSSDRAFLVGHKKEEEEEEEKTAAAEAPAVSSVALQ